MKDIDVQRNQDQRTRIKELTINPNRFITPQRGTRNGEHGTRNAEHKSTFFQKRLCSFKKLPIFALAKENQWLRSSTE